MIIENKSVILTGAAGGIGSTTARRLLDLKAKQIGLVDKSREGLAALIDSLPEEQRLRTTAYPIHVGDQQAVADAVLDFYQRCGSIDALINNAAVLQDRALLSISTGQIVKHPLSEWRETINTNLDGVFYFARECAGYMFLERTKGVIVNVSSISAVGNMGQTGYAASKAAIDALTVTWAQELGCFGIRVAGLAPGLTDTAMPKDSMNPKLLEKWIQRTPMRRMARPEEMADAILYIIGSDFFCGRTLQVDGGFRL